MACIAWGMPAWSRSGRRRSSTTIQAWTPGRRSTRRPSARRPCSSPSASPRRSRRGSTAASGSPPRAAPIQPGDILILVRKRRPFAAAMVTALKTRGIPVAGADRLRLSDQIAVADLVSLGEFLTLPEDDLSLAEVLKSPLIGLDDDDLLQLAAQRKGTLWKALIDARQGGSALCRRGRNAETVAVARRLHAAVRVLRLDPRSRGRPRQVPRAARPGGRRSARRAAQSGARLRRREPALAHRLPGLPARDRARGEARHGPRPQRGARDDRARRQGARGADRVPARHLHDGCGRAGQHAPRSVGAGAARGRREQALRVGRERHRFARGHDRGAQRAQPARGRGAPPAALRRHDAGARPALRRGLRGQDGQSQGVLVRPHCRGAAPNLRGGRGSGRRQGAAPRARANGAGEAQARGRAPTEPLPRRCRPGRCGVPRASPRSAFRWRRRGSRPTRPMPTASRWRRQRGRAPATSRPPCARQVPARRTASCAGR